MLWIKVQSIDHLLTHVRKKKIEMKDFCTHLRIVDGLKFKPFYFIEPPASYSNLSEYERIACFWEK